ncbi:MAG: 3-keto-5-aminohexanoate cleavage protein [Solirubrobacteraceae bacterium]
MCNIDWDRVNAGLERDRRRLIWRPYGAPKVLDLEHSAFFPEKINPPWPMPDKMIISTAITGAFFKKDANPSQPIAPSEIYDDARACAAAGASTVHIHVRDDKGYNTLDLGRFKEVIDPLRDEFPDLAVDGCLVSSLEGEYEEMAEVLKERVLDATPINTTTVYLGDTLFAKPIPMMLDKTRQVVEARVKPIIACYTDADVSNAERFLMRSGLVETPSYWLILPALPGCSPMQNPRQMFDGLLRTSSAIYDVDPEATVMVCAAGRPSMHLVTIAAALGLHIRVGMEDTIYKWPHRDDLITSNLEALEMAKTLASLLGREIADHREYREIVGLPVREKTAA